MFATEKRKDIKSQRVCSECWNTFFLKIHLQLISSFYFPEDFLNVNLYRWWRIITGVILHKGLSPVLFFSTLTHPLSPGCELGFSCFPSLQQWCCCFYWNSCLGSSVRYCSVCRSFICFCSVFGLPLPWGVWCGLWDRPSKQSTSVQE